MRASKDINVEEKAVFENCRCAEINRNSSLLTDAILS